MNNDMAGNLNNKKISYTSTLFSSAFDSSSDYQGAELPTHLPLIKIAICPQNIRYQLMRHAYAPVEC